MPVDEQHVDGAGSRRSAGQRHDGRNGSDEQVADYTDHALVERRMGMVVAVPVG